MAIKDAAQAKQIFQDRASQMDDAYGDGVRTMSHLAGQARKVIEAKTQQATEQGAEDMLGTM